MAVVASPADARRYAPPKGRAFHGVSDTGETKDFRKFARQVGAHPAVMQVFTTWGFNIDFALRRWDAVDARGMLSISTANSYGGEEKLSPYGIAQGNRDGYPLRLNRDIAAWGKPVYIRFLPEMNGHWNPYAAYDAGGTARGEHHRTHWFRQAWRRFALIVRGGETAMINRRLGRLGLPPIQKQVPPALPSAPVALMWVPQTRGSPDVPGNGPRAYWPGRGYVDWVGADMYSRFPNFDGFTRFYRKFRDWPFVVGEYAPWGFDDAWFIARLFAWGKRHSRTKLLVYYQGFEADPFRIQLYPSSRDALRRILDRRRYLPYAPEARERG